MVHTWEKSEHTVTNETVSGLHSIWENNIVFFVVFVIGVVKRLLNQNLWGGDVSEYAYMDTSHRFLSSEIVW